MEYIVYRAHEKYKIIDIKNVLTENKIPISSIKLHIYVEWNYIRSKGGGNNTEKRERRDDLIIPIEEFNDKLNDAQTFEIYTEEEYFDEANKLIEKWLNENYYKNCIFKSLDYEEVENIQRFLRKNNIPIEDIDKNYLEDNEEEYLIFLDPEFTENANNLINNNFKSEEINDNLNDNNDEIYEQDYRWKDPLKNYFLSILIIIVIVVLFYLFRNSIPIVGKLYDKIIELFKNKSQ